MNIIFLLIGLFASNSSSIEMHEYHISNSVINHNTEEEALQITLHLFLDDLEEGLRRVGGDSLALCTKKEKPSAEQYIIDYVNDHYSLSVDGSPVSITYLGKEISEDLSGVWCYFEVANVLSMNQITVMNDILLEVYDDQKNIVTIQQDKSRLEDIIFDIDKKEKRIKI